MVRLQKNRRSGKQWYCISHEYAQIIDISSLFDVIMVPMFVDDSNKQDKKYGFGGRDRKMAKIGDKK